MKEKLKIQKSLNIRRKHCVQCRPLNVFQYVLHKCICKLQKVSIRLVGYEYYQHSLFLKTQQRCNVGWAVWTDIFFYNIPINSFILKIGKNGQNRTSSTRVNYCYSKFIPSYTSIKPNNLPHPIHNFEEIKAKCQLNDVCKSSKTRERPVILTTRLFLVIWIDLLSPLVFITNILLLSCIVLQLLVAICV